MIASSSLASQIHDQLLAACRAEQQAMHRCATLLARVLREGLHVALGYRSILEYAARGLDLTARKARDLLRVGERLTELPLLNAAFEAGTVSWTKARELLGVITPENEARWVEQAEASSSRELERLVHRTVEKDRKAKRADPTVTHVGQSAEPRTAHSRLVVDLETVRLDGIRAAIDTMRALTGLTREEASDGDILADLVARAMRDLDPGRAPTDPRYQMVVALCSKCTEATACAGLVGPADSEATDTTVSEALCDHLELGPDAVSRPGTDPAVRTAVLARDGHRCRVPGCEYHLSLGVHRTASGPPRIDGAVTLCGLHHRLAHDGRLAVFVEQDHLVVEAGDGRRWRTPLDPAGAGPR